MVLTVYAPSHRITPTAVRVKLALGMLVLLLTISAAVTPGGVLFDLATRVLPASWVSSETTGAKEVFHATEQSAEFATVAPTEAR